MRGHDHTQFGMGWFGMLCERCYTNTQLKEENKPSILVFEWQNYADKFQDIYLVPPFLHQIGGGKPC